MVEATEYNRYVRVAGNAVPIGTTGVVGSAALGGHAGAVGQHVSDGVTDSMRGVTRQTNPARVDVGSVGLYPIAGSSKQDSGIAEVMYTTHPGQYSQSQQAASYSPFMDVGVNLVRAPSWNHSTGLWGRAPLTATTMALPPNVSMERWKAGFIPETRGTWSRVVHVERPQLNHVSSLPELMPKAIVSLVGPKAMHPLIKLLSFDGTGSLDTFPTKFQHMASYLCWGDDDMFHHLCASLEGAAEQVLWDIGPRATTADIVCLLQTSLKLSSKQNVLKQSCMIGEGLLGSPSNNCTKTSVGW